MTSIDIKNMEVEVKGSFTSLTSQGDVSYGFCHDVTSDNNHNVCACWCVCVCVTLLPSHMAIFYLQNSVEYLAFAAVSKIFAASVTYPYQVVRSRLQDQHRSYNGVHDVVFQTWRCV